MRQGKDARGFTDMLSTAERELQQAIAAMNDPLVPAVRAEWVRARQEGACLLRQWADRLDEQRLDNQSNKRTVPSGARD